MRHVLIYQCAELYNLHNTHCDFFSFYLLK